MRRKRSALVEAVFWLGGLAAVAVADPTTQGLVALCPFERLGDVIGWSFCPGCGLGHAVGFLVRGELAASLGSHPLALPAVTILTIHALRLIRGAQTHP